MTMNRRKFAACVAGLLGLRFGLPKKTKARKPRFSERPLSVEMLESARVRLKQANRPATKYIIACRPDQFESAKRILGATVVRVRPLRAGGVFYETT